MLKPNEFVKEVQEQIEVSKNLRGWSEIKANQYLATKLEQALSIITALQIRLEESRRLGKKCLSRELANAKKCSEYYKEIKQKQARIEKLEGIIRKVEFKALRTKGAGLSPNACPVCRHEKWRDFVHYKDCIIGKLLNRPFDKFAEDTKQMLINGEKQSALENK